MSVSPDQRNLLQKALGLQGGDSPFPWQEALLERMLRGEVPELIDIPTGLGKTSIIALWLVARGCGAGLPRRLVYCLPMRVLVEQTRSRAVRWAQNAGVLAGQAGFNGNQLKHYDIDWNDPGKVAVVALMGGEAQGDWREHPEHAAIIVGTQDMLLSRALNRGFAMAPQLWPVDFGFLNVDALWVMDEVQLMGPGRTTSVQLQHFWDENAPAWSSRRTVWMSATLGSQPGSLELPRWMQTPERKARRLLGPALTCSEKDLEHEGFKSRWSAPKQLELHFNSDSTDASKAGHGKKSGRSKAASPAMPSAWTVKSPQLIERILQEAEGGRLVLVVLNQVKTACELYARLREKAGAGPDVVLLHARMRPRDRKATYETKLEAPVPPTGRIIAATQVLEAGVDIDADALFTELCPWPSLVQRLGRLNRSGTKPSLADVGADRRAPALAVVFEPLPPERKQGESPQQYEERQRRDAALPYEAEALDGARRQLEVVMKNHSGSVSPETLAKIPLTLSVEGPVLRDFDLQDLFDTDPDLSGGHSDVGPFIRALDRDVDAYLLWRRIEEGVAPDEQVPIHPDELCPVPFYEARDALEDREVWILTLATARKRGAAWRSARGRDIHAGDTVMVDIGAGSYEEGFGWKPGAKEAPSKIVDRWTSDDGTTVRAWVRVEGRTVSLIQKIDDRIVGVRARDEDPRCFAKRWMELDPHLQEAKRRADDLATSLKLPDDLRRSVVSAARWHDVGKALEREDNGRTRRPFQKMLITAGYPQGGHPRDGAFYAKSNRRGGQPAGFRHELASLLSFLQTNQGDDLAAFLILAHHGKVRLIPTAWDEEDPRDLCGVHRGDGIPPVALPCGGNSPLVLDPEVLLPSRNGPGWQGSVQRLLKEHGPFLLAYLEGLVRVADWRAG
jgi:CRISPR-associated endonuclease/helicase Cas3